MGALQQPAPRRQRLRARGNRSLSSSRSYVPIASVVVCASALFSCLLGEDARCVGRNGAVRAARSPNTAPSSCAERCLAERRARSDRRGAQGSSSRRWPRGRAPRTRSSRRWCCARSVTADSPSTTSPFDDRHGLIRNTGGGVCAQTRDAHTGEHVVGRIKHALSGVIGTNKNTSWEHGQAVRPASASNSAFLQPLYERPRLDSNQRPAD
jgi:hypothetical protein